MKKAKYYIILHLILALFSMGGIFSKYASKETMLSREWLINYGAVLALLFIYAIAWQQIIKHMPIITAYINKAVTIIWGIIWGFVFFDEKITINKIIGAIIIIIGVCIVVTGEENPSS
ncbi:MAG: EamA family transporter [Lachnospiraceae bacterium]|nr:EamA family transporter [Lachnospiraceae bacterium]